MSSKLIISFKPENKSRTEIMLDDGSKRGSKRVVGQKSAFCREKFRWKKRIIFYNQFIVTQGGE
jgi:hypothetical protein